MVRKTVDVGHLRESRNNVDRTSRKNNDEFILFCSLGVDMVTVFGFTDTRNVPQSLSSFHPI